MRCTPSFSSHCRTALMDWRGNTRLVCWAQHVLLYRFKTLQIKHKIVLKIKCVFYFLFLIWISTFKCCWLLQLPVFLTPSFYNHWLPLGSHIVSMDDGCMYGPGVYPVIKNSKANSNPFHSLVSFFLLLTLTALKERKKERKVKYKRRQCLLSYVQYKFQHC